MILHVESFVRHNGSVVAFACAEGKLLSEAGVGGDESERRAVLAAVNSFYNRQERPAEVHVHPLEPLSEPPVGLTALADWVANGPSASSVPTRAVVAVDQSSIEAMARAGAEGDYGFRMLYVAEGGERTQRVIEINEVEQKDGFCYIRAWDCNKADLRTFRTDRIERLERLGSA